MLPWEDREVYFSSVHFPGAVNSKFTTKLSFERPSARPAIPTYRVMDSNGVIVDQAHAPVDVDDKEVLTWYKNMLTGTSFFWKQTCSVEKELLRGG